MTAHTMSCKAHARKAMVSLLCCVVREAKERDKEYIRVLSGRFRINFNHLGVLYVT